MTFDPAIIRDSRQLRFHDYWRAKAGSRDMPARADVDPVEFAWMLGWVTLIEPTNDGDWLFVVDGTNVADAFGIDMTGKRLSAYPLVGVRDMLFGTYASAAAAREPYFVSRFIEHDFRQWRYDGLLLPLSSDGARVDRLLSTVVLDGGEAY